MAPQGISPLAKVVDGAGRPASVATALRELYIMTLDDFVRGKARAIKADDAVARAAAKVEHEQAEYVERTKVDAASEAEKASSEKAPSEVA